MDILNATLISLGISSPLLIGLATGTFFIVKTLIDSKFENFKETSIEKLRNELEIKSLESQHRLSIEYDRIKNIHDSQKEKLSKILEEMNSVISMVFDSYSTEIDEFQVINSDKLLGIKRSIYSDGLYIDAVALELISSFFSLAESNSTVVYDYSDSENPIYFDEFDFRLMELIQNQVFFVFRNQIGIDNDNYESSITEGALVLATLSEIRRKIKDEQVLAIFSTRQDILATVSMISEDQKVRKAVLDEVMRLKTEGKMRRESPRTVERMLSFLSERTR